MKTKLNLIAAAALFVIAGTASAQSTTVGTGATAQTGVAIGNNATQANVTGDIFGTGTPVNYTGGIAIGNGAFAAGKNIALGDGLQAIQDGVPNSYSLVIGGLNYNNGLVEYRRVVGMANGLFTNDGANLGQVWQARDQAISTSNAYTDMSLVPVNFRLGNAETRLDQHDVTLANHDARITTAQTTADTALTVATTADTKATTAINVSGQALAIAQQTQQEVNVLTSRVDAMDGRITNLENKVAGMDKRINGGVAISSAMSAAVAPNLAPGEMALVAGVGGFRGQGALSIGIVRSNFAGQTFSAKVSTSSVGTAFAAGGSWKF
jgi:hypothetical protein